MAVGTVNPFEGQPKVGDFFAPFFTVRFLTADKTPAKDDAGKPVDTTIAESGEIIVSQGNSTVKFSEDARTTQLRCFATHLTITNQGGAANICELTFQPPWENAREIVDQQILQFNSIMVIEWGWVSNDSKDAILSDKHYFIIQQPKLEMSGSDVTITVTGIDMFAYSTMKKDDRRTFDRSTYFSDLRILDSIAKKNNFHINSRLTTPESLIRKIKPLSKDEPKVIEQNEKDWTFFGRICDMNNASFFTIGDTIFVVDQEIARVQETAYRLLFFVQPSGPRDIPIISFSTQALPHLFFPGVSKEGRVTYHDDDLGQDVTTAYDPSKMSDQTTLGGPRTAAGKDEADGRTIKISDTVQVIPNPKFTDTETGKHFSVPNRQANRDEFAKRAVRDGATLANTNAECTIPGVPHIVPQQLVRVEGVSKTFSGVYMVLKVVHRIGTDGYECDLTLIREASSGDPVVGKGEKAVKSSSPKQATAGASAESVTAEDVKRPKRSGG